MIKSTMWNKLPKNQKIFISLLSPKKYYILLSIVAFMEPNLAYKNTIL